MVPYQNQSNVHLYMNCNKKQQFEFRVQFFFQFDWNFSEPNKIGHSVSPYNIPSFLGSFYALEVPGIGRISL